MPVTGRAASPPEVLRLSTGPAGVVLRTLVR